MITVCYRQYERYANDELHNLVFSFSKVHTTSVEITEHFVLRIESIEIK